MEEGCIFPQQLLTKGQEEEEAVHVIVVFLMTFNFLHAYMVSSYKT